MGFKLVKVVKRKSPDGGWTKLISYDCGNGEQFAIWDLRGIEDVVIKTDEWRGGISTGVQPIEALRYLGPYLFARG